MFLEVIVVGQRGDVITIDLHETVVIWLLGELIYKATRKDASHLSAVKGLDFVEYTGFDFIAAIF